MELAAAAGCATVFENGLFWDPDGKIGELLSSGDQVRVLDLGQSHLSLSILIELS
jgi:hypothetical protein